MYKKISFVEADSGWIWDQNQNLITDIETIVTVIFQEGLPSADFASGMLIVEVKYTLENLFIL